MTDLHRVIRIIALLSLVLAAPAPAEDWSATGLLESFPSNGLKIVWRAPVGIGFSSPVVVQGKVYVTDSRVTRSNNV
jgi:hypothetical protein